MYNRGHRSDWELENITSRFQINSGRLRQIRRFYWRYTFLQKTLFYISIFMAGKMHQIQARDLRSFVCSNFPWSSRTTVPQYRDEGRPVISHWLLLIGGSISWHPTCHQICIFRDTNFSSSQPGAGYLLIMHTILNILSSNRTSAVLHLFVCCL